MDKILLIYAGFGEGHKKCACSLKEFLNAPCVDLLDFSYPFIKKLYVFLYVTITQYLPGFWAFLFTSTKNVFLQFLATRIQEFLFFPFFEYLRKTKPKVIITTHFFSFCFVKKLKDELGIKLITIVTDIRAHPLWADTCVDMYFAAHDETKEDLLKMGIDSAKIISGYVSLREGFLKDLPENEIRKKFSLDEKPVMLFVSSLRGNFPFIEEIICDIKDKFNIFIIYGSNLKLKEYLQKLNLSSLRIFQSYEQIWEFFRISSIIVTKPGGLTTFEGIYTKKSFILMRYIPGQEEDNMHFLEKYGIGKFVTNRNEFLEALNYFNEKKNELNEHYPVKFLDIRLIINDVISKLLLPNTQK